MKNNQMSLETYEKVSDSYYDADENSHLQVHIKHLINLSNACRKHKCSMSDYQIAHKMYGKGGTIGDSVIIEDKNSVYFGKIGTIVGEVENTYVIKTINGTGIAKKSKVKLCAHLYASLPMIGSGSDSLVPASSDILIQIPL